MMVGLSQLEGTRPVAGDVVQELSGQGWWLEQVNH